MTVSVKRKREDFEELTGETASTENPHDEEDVVSDSEEAPEDIKKAEDEESESETEVEADAEANPLAKHDHDEIDEDSQDEDEEMDREAVRFHQDDFEDIEVDEATLELFNECFFDFMDELGDAAEKHLSECRALILGRAQDIRPIPTTLQEFRKAIPYIFITEEAKELRDEIDEDLDGEMRSPLTVLSDSLAAIAALKRDNRKGQLFQYLAVLTDCVFDGDNFPDIEFPSAVPFIDILRKEWDEAFDLGSELDVRTRSAISKFLAMVPPKLKGKEGAESAAIAFGKIAQRWAPTAEEVAAAEATAES